MIILYMHVYVYVYVYAIMLYMYIRLRALSGFIFKLKKYLPLLISIGGSLQKIILSTSINPARLPFVTLRINPPFIYNCLTDESSLTG